MSKQIMVSDELYKRLKARADENYRPIGQHIEFLLDQVDKMTGNPIAPVYNRPDPPDVSDLFEDPKIKSGATLRDKGDVLADIRTTEAERDEALRNCQDHETSLKITNEYADPIAKLWSEYNGL